MVKMRIELRRSSRKSEGSKDAESASLIFSESAD